MNNQSKNKPARIGIWVILLVVVLGIAAIAFVLMQKRNTGAPAAQYQTVQMAKGTLTASIGATGTVRASQTAILTWQNTGTIGSINVKVGDLVKGSDLLAALTLPPATQKNLETNLINAQENLAELTSPVAIANAKLAITSAQSDVTNTQTVLNNQQYWKNDALIQDQYAKLVIAQDNLDKAQNAYDSAKVGEYINNANEAVAYQNLYNAQKAYDNAHYYYSLYSQSPTQRQMNEAQANLDLAKANLANAQIYLTALTGGTVPDDATGTALLKLKQARLAAQTAQVNLDATKMTAPFAGTITEVGGLVGDQVTISTRAFRIDDLSQMKVDVQVSEVDINSVQVGQPVTLTFDAIAGKTYNGKVEKVAPVGNAIQGAVEFTVTVELTDADDDVKPGMTAAVSIIVKQSSNVLLVPNRAVRVVSHQRVVYILQNGQPKMVPLTLGASSNTQSEVASGDLKVGDVIILNPISNALTQPAASGG
jgi:HlyD family secretion protein